MKNMWFVLSLIVWLGFRHSGLQAAIVINEFLADPPSGLAGDANRDGIRHASQDEFVELFNRGSAFADLSSWSLWDRSSERHRFALGTFLAPQEYFVIFGGGNLNAFPWEAVAASSGSLGLNNAGDEVMLKNALGTVIDTVAYGNEAGRNQSLTRHPKGIGPFDLHQNVSETGLLYSPGTDSNGRPSPDTPNVPEPATFGMLLIAGAAFCLRRQWRTKVSPCQTT